MRREPTSQLAMVAAHYFPPFNCHHLQFLMVSYKRADDGDPSTRSEVLRSYTPSSTTIFASKRKLLRDEGEMKLSAVADIAGMYRTVRY